MKEIPGHFPWYPNDHWWWPDGDKKLIQVLDWANDIDYFMKFIRKPRVCIQAGGATGVWAYRFSQLFKRVYTFEPQRDNYLCLTLNTQDIENIIPCYAPLSDKKEKYSVHNDIHERENYGAGYCVEDQGGLNSVLIDDINLDYCDLIQLDVEGFELNALKGAANTIDKFSPVIVLEEKPLNHVSGDYQAPRKWLEAFGYKQVGAIHRDVVFKRD